MTPDIPINRILAVTSVWCYYLCSNIGAVEHDGPCFIASVLSPAQINSMPDVCAGVDRTSGQRWSYVPVAFESPQAKYVSHHNIFRTGGLPYDCFRLSAVCGMVGTNSTLDLTIHCRNESAAMYQLKDCDAAVVMNFERCLTFKGSQSHRLASLCFNQYHVSNMVIGHVSRYLYIEYCISSVNSAKHVLGFWLFVATDLLTNDSTRQDIEATLVKDMAGISPIASRKLVRSLRSPGMGDEHYMEQCNCTTFNEYIQLAARCKAPVTFEVERTIRPMQKIVETDAENETLVRQDWWIERLPPYSVPCVAMVVGMLFTYLLGFVVFRGSAPSEPKSISVS